MSIQWKFHHTTKALVAAQRQGNSNKCAIAASNSSCSTSIELDHWAVELRGGGGACDSDCDSDVYLVHHPVLMACSAELLNSTSSCDDVKDIADEFNIAMIDNDIHVEDFDEELVASGFTGGTTATASNDECEYTEWIFSIVFHDTWRVPTLYFTCSQLDGTPICRRQVLDILLSHSGTSHDNLAEDGTNSREEELWEFVSQEEHPMTGKPSYFLHPCRTAERMEIMMLVEEDESSDASPNLSSCPLLSWMSMVLPVVGCKVSPLVFCTIGQELQTMMQEDVGS